MTIRKKTVAVLLCVFLLIQTSVCGISVIGGDDVSNLFPAEDYGIDFSVTKKTEEVHLRDPFVLVYENTYFMYGTGAASAPGYGCYVSRDMENWAGPVNVFTAYDGFPGTGCWWAPECHYYNGSFYLFATFLIGATGHRGVGVFRSDNPVSGFELISDCTVTDPQYDALDGTLYVDADGQPWMVYSYEWVNDADETGDFRAAKLSDDLSHFISEPFIIFGADDASWNRSGVTDGPFLYTTDDGKLLCLWSSFGVSGYAFSYATSSDGTLSGEWTQQKKFIYPDSRVGKTEGGHCMIFTALDGNQYAAFHSPNGSKNGDFEKPVFYEVEENDGELVFSAALQSERERSETLLNVLKGFTSITMILLRFLTNFLK